MLLLTGLTVNETIRFPGRLNKAHRIRIECAEVMPYIVFLLKGNNFVILVKDT